MKAKSLSLKQTKDHLEENYPYLMKCWRVGLRQIQQKKDEGRCSVYRLEPQAQQMHFSAEL